MRRCYCGGQQTIDHSCEYGDWWEGWSSTPLQRVEFVPAPDDAEDW